MGVVKRASTRGRLAPHVTAPARVRPCGQPGGTGRASAWLSERRVRARGVGRWRRKPHARESNASRVHGSHVGCRRRREASCLGPSERRIGASVRPEDECDAAAASSTGKRIRFASRARVRTTARNRHEGAGCSTRRKSSIEPTEGVSDHDIAALNQRGSSDPRSCRLCQRPHRAATERKRRR
jgi:hypothetical protein